MIAHWLYRYFSAKRLYRLGVIMCILMSMLGYWSYYRGNKIILYENLGFKWKTLYKNSYSTVLTLMSTISYICIYMYIYSIPIILYICIIVNVLIKLCLSITFWIKLLNEFNYYYSTVRYEHIYFISFPFSLFSQQQEQLPLLLLELIFQL